MKPNRMVQKFSGLSLSKDGLTEAELILDTVLKKAIRLHATTVHFEPRPTSIVVRYRIDGTLRETSPLSKHLLDDIVSIIQSRTGMPLGSRKPQEGTFEYAPKKESARIHASIAPMLDGSKVVLHITNDNVPDYDMAAIGLWGPNYDSLIDELGKDRGLLIFSGPPTSGKSTTLLTCTQQLIHPSTQTTIIERTAIHRVPGAQQLEINPSLGLDVSTALAIAIKQDSNNIIIDELRSESDTTNVFEAASHRLIMTTLSADSLVAAQTYLAHMVPDHILRTSLTGLVHQQLVPKVCSECKISITFPKTLLTKLASAGYASKDLQALALRYAQDANVHSMTSSKSLTAWVANSKGCASCTAGFHGHIMICEVKIDGHPTPPIAIDAIVKSAIGLISLDTVSSLLTAV